MHFKMYKFINKSAQIAERLNWKIVSNKYK